MSEYTKNTLTRQYGSGEGPRARGGPREGGGSLPGSLSTAHIRPRIEWIQGGSIIRATKDRKCEAVGGGKRRNIKGFSKQSRRRLMIKIASVRRDAELPDFVTLTYPDNFPTVEKAKRDLKIFLQRMERKFPMAGGIWKLEPQERGAPHFHMLIWGLKTEELLLWVVKNWYDIAGGGDEKHFLFHSGLLRGSKPCVQKVYSWRGVWSYASKYLGKTFQVAEWGSQWTGRFWGIVNNENIPFGEEVMLEASDSQVVYFMRYQRRFMNMRKGRDLNSLTTFCDSQQWVQKIIFDQDKNYRSCHPPIYS